MASRRHHYMIRCFRTPHARKAPSPIIENAAGGQRKTRRIPVFKPLVATNRGNLCNCKVNIEHQMSITLLQEQGPPKSLQDDARGFHRFVMTPLLLLPWRERAREPRRVGIVLDRPSAPPWVTALADSLKPFDVGFFALSRDIASGARRSGWLADRLCELSKRKFDPYTETPVECGHLAAASCDILIWLAGSGVNTPPTALAPCGALSVRFGDKPDEPFFDECFEGNPCTKVFVRWDDVVLPARSIREAELSTVMGLYFTRNAEGPLTAAVRMLAWLCAGIGYEESLSLDRLRALPDKDVELARRTEWPSSFDTGHFVAKKLLRRARLHCEAAGRVPWWSVWMRPKAGELSRTAIGRRARSHCGPVSPPERRKDLVALRGDARAHFEGSAALRRAGCCRCALSADSDS